MRVLHYCLHLTPRSMAAGHNLIQGQLRYQTAAQPWKAKWERAVRCSLESTALCLSDAFKVMLLALVLARAPLQPCPCPATHLTNMAMVHGLNFLASPQALLRHYGRVWWSGLLAEPSYHHWVCSARLPRLLWDRAVGFLSCLSCCHPGSWVTLTTQPIKTMATCVHDLALLWCSKM